MTLNINGYEVKITAKHQLSDKANKRDTMDFLNLMSIWASEASKWNEYIGGKAIPKEFKKSSEEIYKYLKQKGCYKNA